MNIFLINWDYNNKNFLKIAKKLEANGHKIVYWSGAAFTEVRDDSRRLFPQVIFHDRRQATLGIPAAEFKNSQFAPPSPEIIASLHEAESILLTLKQFEKLAMGGFEKKNLYHSYLEYWLGAIKQLKPDAIIFAICPHTGYDYIIYRLAKILNIKTILFEYSGLADRHLLVNDYTVGSPSLRREIENNKSRRFTLDDLSLDIKADYLRQTDGAGATAASRFKAIKKNYSGLNLLRLNFNMIKTSVFDQTIFKKVYSFFLKKFGQNFKKEYLALQVKPDFNKRFIYLSLHYQPECATAPLGGIFVDQILMIKILSAALPEDWLIYVKEHPDQWLMQGLNYTSPRYPGYFKAIAKINKVKLVPVETPAKELIKKSQAVATVTGTAGREAALNLKPALIFGYALYRDCPGVFKVSDVPSCRAALAKIILGFKVNQQEIINYLVSLDKVSFHSFFEITVEKFSNLSQAEHVNILAEAINKDLKNDVLN